MKQNQKLIHGFGINDIGCTTVVDTVTGKLVVCPFYSRWSAMIARCYSIRRRDKETAYLDCTVCEEWRYFSNFKFWMEKQDWEGKHLDKDLVLPGNKIYSPDNCVFVSARTNTFMNDSQLKKNDLPIGVKKFYGEYTATISDGNGNQILLGYFETSKQAHQAWLKAKLELAKILAAEQDDPRVAKALIERYENYEH